ncbi:MAG: dual specificity protein phosphatase family protein [Chloroflexi bacterium]|nr:dual specificity protein phosphatase family protein [Chloroflexota bacterium]
MLNPFGRIWLRIIARLHEYSTKLDRRRLNLSWIDDQLAVGGSILVRDYPKLAAMGITAVIDARKEARDRVDELERLGMRFLHLPTPDRYALTEENIGRGVAWALEERAAGGKLFVHCEHGVGRAPLLGSAILISSGLSAPEALRLIRTKRWQAAPNDRQLEALLRYEAARRGSVSASL